MGIIIITNFYDTMSWIHIGINLIMLTFYQQHLIITTRVHNSQVFVRFTCSLDLSIVRAKPFPFGNMFYFQTLHKLFKGAILPVTKNKQTILLFFTITVLFFGSCRHGGVSSVNQGSFHIFIDIHIACCGLQCCVPPTQQFQKNAILKKCSHFVHGFFQKGRVFFNYYKFTFSPDNKVSIFHLTSLHLELNLVKNKCFLFSLNWPSSNPFKRKYGESSLALTNERSLHEKRHFISITPLPQQSHSTTPFGLAPNCGKSG